MMDMLHSKGQGEKEARMKETGGESLFMTGGFEVSSDRCLQEMFAVNTAQVAAVAAVGKESEVGQGRRLSHEGKVNGVDGFAELNCTRRFIGRSRAPE
jgi:hypothetical protein